MTTAPPPSPPPPSTTTEKEGSIKRPHTPPGSPPPPPPSNKRAHKDTPPNNAAAAPPPPLLNEYQGTIPTTIDTLPTSISPSSFFANYIAPRKPVLIKHTDSIETHPHAALFTKWTTTNYLKEKAGEAMVRVETRTDTQAKYGQGTETNMTFGVFLDALEGGNECLYLTTQELECGSDDRPTIMSSPVTELYKERDFPLRPPLMGNLVPQNVNLWMGRSKEGSSSGLHHDYHDNLYLVLRGKKQFQLYPPSLAPQMYTVGTPTHIHTNGRINYSGQPPTHADGRELSADRAYEAAKKLEMAVKRAFGSEKHTEREKEEGEAEAALDEALDAMLDAEMEGEEEEDDDDDEEEEEEQEEEEQVNILQALTSTNQPTHTHIHTTTFKKDGTTPANFSRVTLPFPTNSNTHTHTDTHIDREQFPLFPTEPPLVVEVGVGEMLYLPAGWFHCVTSMGGGGGGDDIHAAFNYWFHPPDNLSSSSSSSSSFSCPYTSPFWPRDWEEKEKAGGTL